MTATLLLVGDGDDAREHVRRTLESVNLDIHIREARDAATALALARDDVDVVLLQAQQRGIDSLTLLADIRRVRDSSSLPVLWVADDEAERESAFAAGVTDFLARPFSPAELLARLQVQLRVKLLEDELRRANERHRRLGTHDDLTGLANRRHLLEQCRRELARSRRHQFHMTVCAVAADNFRQINSRVGFLAGDAIIVELSRLLERALRTADLLARVSGTRFVALLPQVAHDQAQTVGERLRAAVAAGAFGGLPAGTLVLSVGLATYPQSRLESVDEMINAAEASLDRAKGAGGNRVTAWRDEKTAPEPSS